MHIASSRSSVLRILSLMCLVAGLATATAARAAMTTYIANLDGPSEASPNASPGSALARLDVDPATHLMRLQVTFSGLLGTTTAAHIHAPTSIAGTGAAGVATMLPSFAGFPLGVTAGSCDQTYDMTLSASFNPTYVTNNGGTMASAELALYQAIADGKAYHNIHSSVFGGGEIRGFFRIDNPTAARGNSWGRIKSLYQ